MRSTSALRLLVVLSLTSSSLSAPIPVPVEECSNYASCRPYHRSPQRLNKQQSKESSYLQEPHFPAHQLEFSKHADTVEVGLLEHHRTTPEIVIQQEPSIKNPKLNTILKAAHRDKVSSKKKLHIPNLKEPKVKKYGFTTRGLEKVQSVATTRSRKCSSMGDTVETEHTHRDGRVTITYTYGYRYMRTDYTSVLVVSIVVIFFLAIILVELLDKVIET
jgi:hypothetical protein